jgi:tetratricopeptide (TPR) repeat protein
MEQQFTQVHVLLETKRYGDAESKLREILARTPASARAHGLLSFALYRQDRDAEALKEANVAIGLDPTDPSGHYYRALALLALERDHDALAAIREAIRLNAEFAPFHATLSRIYVSKKNWTRALAAAEEGLRLDPEDVQCTNFRALALVNLGRKDEADQSIAAALARDPENAMTHANLGWALLHRGDSEQALTHFREALRLSPLSDWAREGIVEALKARNAIYRLMLRYFLWMSRLTAEEQWGVVAALSGVRRALRVIARQVPILYVILLPLFLLYFLFAVLTWTARPLFALFLRFDRFGRLALPREEIVASNWVGACLLTSALSLILGIALVLSHGNVAFFVLALVALAMIVPISGAFRCRPGPGRIVLTVYTVLLGLIGLAAFLAALPGSWWLTLAGVLGVVFFIAWMSYSWIANLVIALSNRGRK